ncbi:MAG: NIPSNAP family protein [Flavobacterium sp.]|nr:NIPSNAP family protein [Pedobacter sp.]
MKFKFNILIALILLSAFSKKGMSQTKARSFYEIKVYHIQGKDQENLIDGYLKDAYLPALGRRGFKNVGVFKPIGNDTLKDQRIYVLIPFKSLNEFIDLPKQLERDALYKKAGAPYLGVTYNKPAYKRLESILLQAFPEMTHLKVPALKNSSKERVYELRSYEGYSEEIYDNKVRMFNEGGEVKLFERLGFNAVFYASVIAGGQMPNLMYMTTFEDMTSREEHWKTFGNDPEWKKLSTMEKYQNNVSHIDITFLRPTDYSGI